MPFYRFGNTGILIRPGDGVGALRRIVLPPPPEPVDGLTPAWLVEYVDSSGARQRTPINNNGSTSITIRQYANVTFDARASRSEATNCDTAWGAAQLMGFGVHYGESLGGVWPTSGGSRDFNIGPPIFSRCYSTSGAHTASLYIRDPDGRESTVTFTVNVLPLGSIMDISSGGSWPTWVKDGVYGLMGDDDYNPRGPISLGGLTGVRIIKIGGSSDPIVGQFQPEHRGVDHGSIITNRAKDNVLVNIDYATYAEGPVGTDYCGSYGGRCRHFGGGEIMPKGYLWDNSAIAAANPINAANIRHSRGLFVVASGPIDGSEGLPNYALIGGCRSMNFAGTTFARTTGNAGGNPLRTYMDSTVLRDTQIYSTTETYGLIKGSLYSCIYQATPTLPWPEDDSWGDYDTSRALYLANGMSGIGAWTPGPSYFWVCDNLFGGPGNYDSATYVGGWNPQNNLVPTNGLDGPWTGDSSYESGEIGGWERNRLAYNTGGSITLGGRHLSVRGNTQLSGAPCAVELGVNETRVHPDFRGPYISSPRPVHSAFED